jgi:hypothetical protein
MKDQFLLKALFASGLIAASAQLACSAESSDPYPNGGGNRPGTGATGGTAAGAGGDPTGAGGTLGTGGSPTGTGGDPTGAGGAPTGGAPTGGPAMTCAPQVGSATDLLISDLESGANAINAPRTGYWFSFGDGTGTMPPPGTPFAPDEGGNGDSKYYAHFTCTGGKYVGMGFDLNNCNMKPHPYDVSAYTGVSFAYKSTHDFKFMVGTVATTLPADGGTCSPEPDCRNHHATVIPASASWTTIQVPFNTLVQDFGVIAALDKTKVLQLQFQVSGTWNDTTQDTDPITPAAVDLSIDDVSFY